MAKNISLLGADYPDVPAVVLPQTGGGEAMFLDADGFVQGPDSATNNGVAIFDGTTGKIIKNSSKTITDKTSSTAIANNANMPTNRTIYNGIYNGLDKTDGGFMLDARQGKTLADKIGNIQHYEFTCLKNGGKLQFASSNGNASWWLIFCGRGTVGNDFGAWMAVIGSTSAIIRDLATKGANITLEFNSTTNKLTLTNGDTTNDVYVSVVRIFGTGTMTATQA